MAGICTSVDYALELLKGLRLPMGNDYDTLLYWKDKIQLQLKFLRTFLRYTAKWSDDDKAKYLGSLPMNIEAALKVAEPGLAAACTAEANDNLRPGQWTLLTAFFDFDGSISPFEGQVAESYNYLSTVSHPPVSDHHVFDEFVYSVQENLEDLAFKLQKNYIKQGQTPPSGALDLCLAVKRKLEDLRCFFCDLAKRCIDKEKMEGPLAHLAAVVFSIAQLSYRCLPHTRLNVHFVPRELFLTLADLSRKVTPHTPKFVEVYRGVLDVYVGILKASKPSGSLSPMRVEDAASSLLSFLCSIRNQVDILCEGLAFPSMALLDTPEDYSEETELILKRGIADVAREAGSLDYSFGANELQDKVSEANCMFSKLLQQIKLIKAEIFLLELQNHRKNLMNPPKDRFEALREMLRFLSSFFRASYEDAKDSGKLILTHIVAVVREAVSFHNSFHAIKITEDVILSSSLEIFKLCKAEAMLMMLINNTASLTFLVKYRIQTLHKGLRFLRELLTVRPKNEEDGEFSSTLIETVAAEATCFVCSFGDSKIKDDHSMEMKVWLSHFAGMINPIKAEIKAIYLRESLLSIFPKTDGFGFIEFILQKLKELLTYKPGSVELIKDQVERFLRELEFLGPFLRDVTKLLIVHQELKDIGTQIIGLIYEAEYVVDLYLARDDPVWYHQLLLFDVIEEIKLIKSQVEFYYNKRDDHQFQSLAFTSRYLTSDASTSEASILRHSISEAINPRIDEAIVGFDDQADILINQLMRGSMHLDIVSIVGMPGLGKTALAKKILIDPSIKYHFIVLAWCCISQVYKKGEVLLDLLGDVIDINDENDGKNDYEIRNKSEEKLDKIKDKSEEDLAQTLYQELKGKRYLIVMDDMWTIEPWNDLKCLFPDDENGSRVLFTSRIREVALQGNPNKEPHSLRSLSDEESWELLQNRLFHGGSCPKELLEVGGQIAKNCKGYPLAVVVIAGLLKRTDKNKNWWKKVAENLRSHILDDPQKHFMEILALSYNHLPDYLKPCFLYFASFLEDQHIPVWKLKCMWISEGFIPQNCEKSLEEIAEYLMELIGRSLVIEATKRSKGGTKACHVHDMLRDLCLEKAREENFLRLISRHDRDDPQYYFPSNIITCEQYRLCIHSEKESFVGVKSFGPCIHSLLYYATSNMEPSFSYDIQFIFHQFKLLRVLDLECITIGRSFPSGIELLVQLRYLALRGRMNSIPSSIANLWSLETFRVKGMSGEVVLPNTIWGMARLRHVQVNNRAAFSLPGYEHESSVLLLHNLATLSSPTFSYGKEAEKVLKRLVGLRKLRCIFLECLDSSRNCNMFPPLDLLTQLESLKIFYYGRILFPCEFSFPLNLKKLTLSKFHLPWEYISAFTRLPNLEVLKLLSRAFDGQTWNMAEGEFLSLRFLKLENLNIVNWNASYDHFPKLQRLVLQSCKKLEEVPSCFGEISTLQMIEVHWCSPSAANSAGMIEEQQIDMGNEEFKVLIQPPAWDLRRTS